ncbi:MAG TPA: DNA polymerase I [Gammaproteobacteria bacterium]|nr:DNA polymerase I [Gammaproteobacteria bacterium]
MSPSAFVIVDGSSFLYRAFHALPALTNAHGEPTGAIHGFLSMLERLRARFRPHYLAVVFDAPGGSFREALFADYKANRDAMPDDLRAQQGPLYEIIDALGIARLVITGVEADDVIATLAHHATVAGLDTLIASSDKDLAQLVSDTVRLVAPLELEVVDATGVHKRYGVGPECMVDLLTLMGDTADNVPGVPGVGPKTAAKWLQEYGNLDALVAHANEIKGKVGERLREYLPQLELSRRLVRLESAVALPVGVTDLAPGIPDVERLRGWYTRLGFQRLLRELDRGAQTHEPRAVLPVAPAVTEPDQATVREISAATPGVPADAAQDHFQARYVTITDEAAWHDWLARIRNAPLVAFDAETTSLDYLEARLVGMSFSVAPDEAAYLPLAHVGEDGSPLVQLPIEQVLAGLKDWFEDPACPKVGHHLKYDAHVLANHGIRLRGIAEDTLLASYVLDSAATRHDLDTLALGLLGHRNTRYEEVTGKGAKQIAFAEVPLAEATAYAGEDAAVCLALQQVLAPRLAGVATLDRIYRDIELPLVPVLLGIERHGVKVDTDMLAEQGRALAEREAELAATAHRLAGHEFNLGSPRQIQQVLFDELGLRVSERTPKGQPSTAESALAEIAHDHPLPQVILEHRAITKLRSTYIDKLPALVNTHTGRVHTSYHQAVAATGRLSSSDPNLQNIPVRTAEGRRIRRAFVAETGNSLLAADYSQIELRIMAHLSADAGLCAAFEQGEDVHRRTAAEVFGLSSVAVGEAERRAAKAINFGLIYGMSAFGLARQLGIDRQQADAYIARYFDRYPGVRDYMDRTRAQARQQGYVETLFGRRLNLPEIHSRQAARRQHAERTAINAPMQGTAADIIKRAMLAVAAWLDATGFPARMIMQVHDELVFEVSTPQAEALAARVRELMAGAAELAVPLVVDVGMGPNWDEAH